jgi:hypothetical protein
VVPNSPSYQVAYLSSLSCASINIRICIMILIDRIVYRISRQFSVGLDCKSHLTPAAKPRMHFIPICSAVGINFACLKLSQTGIFPDSRTLERFTDYGNV